MLPISDAIESTLPVVTQLNELSLLFESYFVESLYVEVVLEVEVESAVVIFLWLLLLLLFVFIFEFECKFVLILIFEIKFICWIVNKVNFKQIGI